MKKTLQFISLFLYFASAVANHAKAQTQSLTGSMTTARQGHSATLLSNGNVLIAGGGTNGTTVLSSAELYSPSTGTFAITGSMTEPRQGQTATLLQDGTVLVVGGDVGYTSTTAELYSPATGKFTYLGALNAQRNIGSYTATLLPSGQVLIAGGSGEGTSNVPLASAELYNPSTKTFTLTGRLNTARAYPSTVLLQNGEVLVAGGVISNVQTQQPLTGSAELYNPSTGSFSSTGSEIGTDANPAIVLSNGNVLFGNAPVESLETCSGRGCHPSYGITGSSPGQIFSPTTNSFSATSLNFGQTPYGDLSLSGIWEELMDGNILIVHGDESGNSGTVDPIQIYSQSTGALGSGGQLLVARDGTETVTPLMNGAVLIAGGLTSAGTTATAELYADSGVTGIIHPKYIVVGVTYAPPGPSSYVQYADSVTVGTTNTLTKSLKTGESLSISVGTTAGIPGWLDGSLTGTSTTSFSQETSGTKTVTVSEQASLSFKTGGTPNAFSPVNHDWDYIWLWLNPIIELTVSPNNPNALTWNGYGFDEADQPALDIWPVYVGYLNGDFGPMDPEDAKVLSRSWSTGQTFPASGQTPALNASDYAQILLADPFANSSYAVTLSGNTTTDGRFTLSGGPTGESQTFPYKQAAPGGTPLQETYVNTYTSLNSLGESSTNTYEQAFSLDEKFNTGVFFDSLSVSLEETGSITLTSEALTTISSTATETDTLFIQGPPCTGATSCSPAYVSPAEFDVYQDNVYGTFMFNPVN